MRAASGVCVKDVGVCLSSEDLEERYSTPKSWEEVEGKKEEEEKVL